MGAVDISDKVRRIIAAYKQFQDYDSEVAADIAAYFCVLIYGHYESAVKGAILDHAGREGSPELARFVQERLKRQSNLKSSQLKELLGSFSSEWKETVGEKINERIGCNDALNSLVDQRNSIAHGRCVDLRMDDLHQWKEHVDEVITWVRDALKPSASEKS